MENNKNVLMSVKNLKTFYKTRLQERVYAVDDVSIELHEGQIIGIAGESGCGKSTLALSLLGYYFPPLNYESGSIVIDGQEIISMSHEEKRKRILGEKIAYIPQAAMNALNPTLRIINFVHDIIKQHKPDMSNKDISDMAAQRFEQVNLPRRVLKAYPNELSGGMKQRTVIAISTILNPKILIADEPSSALDVTSQKVVITMLRDMMDKGFIKGMYFITHELPLLRHISDDIVIMYAGELCEKGTVEQVIFDPRHPYSKALMGSIIVPEEGMKAHNLYAIPGAPPNLKSVPPGCRFADRCRFSEEKCVKNIDRVPMVILPEGREYRCRHSEAELNDMFSKDFAQF